MRKLNVSNKSNVRCERCLYYTPTERLKNRGSTGHCSRNNEQVKYYNKCDKFLWKSKYTSCASDVKKATNMDSKILCKRCGKVLTDADSISRGFGKQCYEHRLKALEKRHRRFF